MSQLPPCYAIVIPGVEEVAAEEITRDLGGEVRKTGPGYVVFRVTTLDTDILRLRTTEDVFLFAWGTDELTHRAVDLDRIERWTAHEPDWQSLLRLHHTVHARPRGKPTYRLVTQMSGEHVYHRKHAREALARGLSSHLPASWRPAEENAAVEVWLTIQGSTAFCGLRLSTREMRHRTYKAEHVPASLRPSVAATMVRLAGVGPGMVVVDPMCGAGTIVAEQLELLRSRRGQEAMVLAGDCERSAVRAADVNLRPLGPSLLALWDARRLPLADSSVDRVVSNPPFGKQLGEPAEIEALYLAMVSEYNRVLRPGGRAVLLTSAMSLLDRAARSFGWRSQRRVEIRVLGQRATISVWRTPEE
jgi:23S rRNA G2445 N2-methylase RlmL